MSYLVLARKYRPQTFEEVLGQEHITRTLQNAIQADRVAHALLFAGPRGVGKTSVARIMAKALNCQQGPTPSPCNVCPSCREITEGVALDVIEIDGASNRGIDEIRELRESIKFMPARGRFKIYIIDEVHMLTDPAFNALLKTLEEPPKHALFFFATTEPNKIPITILSRCQRHNFRRIPLADIVGCLKNICRKLSFNISDTGLHTIASEASGGLRDALSLLDQVMAYSGGQTSDEEVLESLGVIDRTVLFDLAGTIFDGNIPVAIDLLGKLYGQGHDMKRLYRQMLGHLRNLLIVKMNHGESGLIDAPEDEIARMKHQIEAVSLEVVHQIFTTWFEAESSVRFSGQPKLALEILFVKLGQFKNIVPFENILKRLDHMAKALEDTSASISMEPLSALREKGAPYDASHQDASPAKPAPTILAHNATLGETWARLLPVFGEKCKTIAPCLEKASLTKIGKNFLEITIHGNSFYADRLKDPKNNETIQDVCHEFFGKTMEIRINDTPQEGTTREKKRGESDREKRLKREALDNPVVTEALEVFDGRVVDVKIL